MPKLSITNYELDYGVNVDDIFWVRHGVLRREDVRTSLDEQVVLDILIDCLIEPTPNTGSDVRDEYYDFAETVDDELSPSQLSIQIGQAIDSYGPEELERDVMKVYDVIRGALDSKGTRFATLVGVKRGGHSPRYFHAVFMAIFELMFKERMRVRDFDLIHSRLTGITRGALSIPKGSDWTGEAKQASFDAVKGVLRIAFEEAGEEEDFGRYGWAWQLETIFGNALVEQQLFDCKQGFLRLDKARSFDGECLASICKTLSAMANMGRSAVGYVLLGVADNARAASRVKSLDAVEAQIYRGFHIVGIDREARAQGLALNDYWTQLMQRIRDHKQLHPRLAAQVGADARLANYHGLAVGILKVTSMGEPSFYGDDLYERSGSETRRLERPEYLRIYSRLLQSSPGA